MVSGHLRSQTLLGLKSLLRRGLGLCILSVNLVACSASSDPPSELSMVPAPPWIQESDFERLQDGRLQLSFEADEEYPSSRVRDFYAQWAADHGWTKVAPETERWSGDHWVTFRDADATVIHQWTVHWRSPDGAESLRLALLHTGDRARQYVYVIRSPYYVLGSSEPQYSEDGVRDPSCPEGILEEPVARQRPLPAAEVIHDHCPDGVLVSQVLFSIAPTGKVESINLVHGTGCRYADEEIRRCASEWLFEPATCDGQPVSVERGLAVAFNETRRSPSDSDPCPAPQTRPSPDIPSLQ